MLDLPSPALIGVIHLPALPGNASSMLTMDAILAHALADARALTAAGFDAAFIENFGDAPFGKTLSPASLAAMAVVADHVRRDTGIRIGINALRNDPVAALSIAAACSATFIRVNVHTGVYATDQGLIEGNAAETLRVRKALGGRVAILADVHVKHAMPLSMTDIAQSARDTAYRGLADGLIVTGQATGMVVDAEDLKRVTAAVPDRRVFVGSGATTENAAAMLRFANGVIVGTSLKRDGVVSNPIDPDRARAFIRATGRS